MSLLHKIPILASGYHQFCEAVQLKLGKGFRHAGMVYEQFFRRGKIDRSTPAFGNAQSLVDAILQETDFSLPPLSHEKTDGSTGKFLVKITERLEVESVIIPMQSGGTLCVSSQVGCRMGCAFCETGRMGLLRQLTAQEITAQLYIARHHLGASIRNVVFMGMGEPFDNYDAVLTAARVFADPKGFGLGKRHLTISTSGCADGIDRLRDEPGETPNLAVSITAPDDELRKRLMPVTRKFNLARLHDSMKSYCEKTKRQILIAYVLLDGVNDTLEHADRLAEYLQGLHVKINLIPYNPQSNDRFAASPLPVVEAFSGRLRDRGYRTFLRITKGDQIMAACGQLGNVGLRTPIKSL